VTSSAPSGYDLATLVSDLIAHARSHLTQNAIVIPVLQTFNILIGGDALDRLSKDSEGLQKFVCSEDSEIILNAFFQPPRASCACTAKCGSLKKCGEDPGIYEVCKCLFLSLYLYIGHSFKPQG